MDEKEKCMNCEDFNGEEPRTVTKAEIPEINFIGDMPDEVIIIPVSEYKHLVKCEATVELIHKLLAKYGEYSSERTKIMEVITGLLVKKEGPFDA
jgi:hypothetical protein